MPRFFAFSLFLLFATAFTLVPRNSVAEGLGGYDLVAYKGENSEPLQVGVGLFVDQITFVDQQAENFGVVATLFMEMKIPEFAYTPEPGELPFRHYAPDDFQAFAKSKGIQLPIFIFRNQQGRRFEHQGTVILESNGSVVYLERFSATLQAPYFNFRQYPFDTQVFYIELSSLLPEEFVQFYPLNDESGLGNTLGEEEWILFNPSIASTTVPGIGGRDTSQVALRFEAKRHIIFYSLRILLPLLIILFVSWATFFLEEYRRRIDMASANLLVFVAFNFAISTSLPKLGYLTFMDSLLVGMFIITGSMVLVNIALRRLKINGRESLARKIDRYLVIWVYPLTYAAVLFWAVKFYLL